MKPYKGIQLLSKIKSLFSYVFDKEVPFYKKIVILLGFGYLLFPFDIIPDPILGLGMIDDIAILIFIFNSFQKELEKDESNKASNSINKKNIVEDIDYKVKDEDEKGE